MTTGCGILTNGELRPEVCPGDWLPDIVGTHSTSLAAGAWIDAPDTLPAGGMYRCEEWNGLVGRARPGTLMASRS